MSKGGKTTRATRSGGVPPPDEAKPRTFAEKLFEKSNPKGRVRCTRPAAGTPPLLAQAPLFAQTSFLAQASHFAQTPSLADARIILIRHTRVAVAPGVCYGQTDVPLAKTFSAEAAEVRVRLPWLPGEIHTSPLARCLRLADYLGASVVHRDRRLLELDFGEWENRAWADFRSPESEAWARDPLGSRPPGGETGDELHARVGAIRAELLGRIADDEGLRIAVITHAGVIRSWLAHAGGRGLMEFFGAPVPQGVPVAGE